MLINPINITLRSNTFMSKYMYSSWLCLSRPFHDKGANMQQRKRKKLSPRKAEGVLCTELLLSFFEILRNIYSAAILFVVSRVSSVPGAVLLLTA